MPLRSLSLLVIASAWSLLVGVILAFAPDLPGRLWLGIGAVAAGWAVAAVFAARAGTGADSEAATPMARLDADLSACLSAFDEQFRAVEADTAQILGALADAVDQLTRSFSAMQTALGAVAPRPGADDAAVRANVRALVAAVDRVVESETATRQRDDALTQEIAARVAQAGVLLREIDGIGQEVGMLASNVSVEAARGHEAHQVAVGASQIAALSARTQAAGAQIGAVLAVMQTLIEQARAAVAANHAQRVADAATLKAGALRWLADGPPQLALDHDAARVIEALQFQDIVGQMVGHMAARIGGMREALAELGAVAHDAARARDAGAVRALCERAERIGHVLKGVAERGARPPVRRGATPDGSVELF